MIRQRIVVVRREKLGVRPGGPVLSCLEEPCAGLSLYKYIVQHSSSRRLVLLLHYADALCDYSGRQ